MYPTTNKQIGDSLQKIEEGKMGLFYILQLNNSIEL